MNKKEYNDRVARLGLEIYELAKGDANSVFIGALSTLLSSMLAGCDYDPEAIEKTFDLIRDDIDYIREEPHEAHTIQ